MVASETVSETPGVGGLVGLSISSTGNSIKHFTIGTDDPDAFGIVFTDIVWGCN